MKSENGIRKQNKTAMLFLFVVLVFLGILPLVTNTHAAYWDNTTVLTTLNVSNAPPITFDTVMYDWETQSKTNIYPAEGTVFYAGCNATVNDSSGWEDISSVVGQIYYYANSTHYEGAVADNNYIYYNNSCNWTSAGDALGLQADIVCKFTLQFYADPGAWNCTINASDADGLWNSSKDSSGITLDTLAAIDLPVTTIDYGVLNVTDYSTDVEFNITNSGNTDINISVDGYGKVDGDGAAMNCSAGSSIPLNQERYATSTGVGFAIKTPLTDTALPNGISGFTISQRTSESVNTTGSTYWQLYVPSNVRTGLCNGTIVFSAVI